MLYHISVRLAWHDNGWDGFICKNPKANAYCVGPYSYPGDLIALERDLNWEEKFKRNSCLEVYTKIKKIPPCCYSINAFGKEEIYAKSDPPDFFKDNTKTKIWKLPPASICTWPYEEMYKEEVRNPNGTYSYEKRLKAAEEYFSNLEPGKTLVFYYANYSNPFSENDQKRYVIVGVSRLKKIGDQLFYEGCSEETKKKFAGGFIWQRVLTSSYPEEGLRIPYHIYLDKPDVLEKIALFPDNPRNFKYGTRHISDDDALDLIERFIEIVAILKEEIKDTTGNWEERLKWLRSVIAELWKSRGLFPGLLKVLDYIGFHEAIEFYKNGVTQDPKLESKLKQEVFDFLNEKVSQIKSLSVDESVKKRVLRQWKLKTDIERKLLEDVLPRFDLSKEQIERILSNDRKNYGIYSNLEKIVKNPYILCEEYTGDDPDDFISFNKIDYGIFPSPELGKPYSDFVNVKDDARRLRALCVEQLRKESQHTFILADYVINKINHKLSYLPDWKRSHFNLRYIEVDKDVLSEALEIRKDAEGKTYLYLKANYEFEREIERQIRNLAKRADIELRIPLTEKHWKDYLYDSKSPILKADPSKYDEIQKEQAEVCARIFVKPISVISGGAGTGKTTIIKAIIQAIEKVEGKGTIIKLFAPTGKAADRLREVTGKEALTIHSFLASQGWLNNNLTFKREGGKCADITTVIIDEASMLDLQLLGTLFRAINWNSVKRLIFVGDQNQLPPIGTGKVFSDILDWLQENYPENVGILKTNVRQLLNQIENKGTGILELASLYMRRKPSKYKDTKQKFKEEEILKKVQEGGDIDKDLRVIYWKDLDDLKDKLIETIIKDLECDTGSKFNPDKPFEIWAKAFRIKDYNSQEPDYMQIISPYRGEFFGVDNINLWIQETFNKYHVENKGTLNGYFDKIIQYRNRTKSNPIKAYNTETRRQEEIEVFNGEIGFVNPHSFDCKKVYDSKMGKKIPKYAKNDFRVTNFDANGFQIVFKRKKHLRVEYKSKQDVEENLELAYAISVHKAQGSEFNRVYFVLPKSKKFLLTTELLYTGLTRATKHCTLLIEEDISPLLTLLRSEHSQLNKINSSLFEFKPVPEELLNLSDWYEEGKVHRTLAGIMVRSKSEVIIANLLYERGIPFKYEVPLYAPDGTFYIPDFTITWGGEEWYWEHLGMLDKEEYRNHWEAKREWYNKYGFSKRLIVTDEKEGIDSRKFEQIIQEYFKQ